MTRWAARFGEDKSEVEEGEVGHEQRESSVDISDRVVALLRSAGEKS